MRDETAQLRAGLDEREIFWIDIPLGDGKRTCWKSTDDQDGYCYFDEDVFGVTVLMVTGISAEEVIAATLGAGKCNVDVLNTGDCAGYECSEYIMHCNGCGYEFGHVLYNADGNHECDSCEYDNEEGKCDYERRMRELGIGVNE